MNTIREKIATFKVFLNSFRRSGTTEFIARMAAVHDIIVIIESQQEKKDSFNNMKNVFTIDDIKRGKLDGINKKPFLLDNHVLLNLIGEMEHELRKKDSELLDYKETLSDIAHSINKLHNKQFKK